MTLSADVRDMLVSLLRGLTPGHVSTLVASMNEPDSRIGTSTDSKNYVVLQKLCELGLATEVPLELDMPPGMDVGLTSFLIHEDAKPEIGELLRAAASNMDGDT